VSRARGRSEPKFILDSQPRHRWRPDSTFAEVPPRCSNGMLLDI